MGRSKWKDSGEIVRNPGRLSARRLHIQLDTEHHHMIADRMANTGRKQTKGSWDYIHLEDPTEGVCCTTS